MLHNSHSSVSSPSEVKFRHFSGAKLLEGLSNLVVLAGKFYHLESGEHGSYHVRRENDRRNAGQSETINIALGRIFVVSN